MDAENMSFDPALCRAARALLDWSQAELAERSKVATKTLADFERGKTRPYDRTLLDLKRAFEAVGVEFTNGDGPGVRLRKTGEADRMHALQHAEEAADRHLADVDAHPEEKAKRKRIVAKLAKDLTTGVTRK